MSHTIDSPMRESPMTSTPPNVPGMIVQRNKKSTSTGGGRAWSSEEAGKDSLSIWYLKLIMIQETYLIETRTRKMPYKHIAAHLKKTELACRLHYHQLSFGNKRHRRAPSSSAASPDPSPSSPPTIHVDMMQQRQLPPFNPSSTPDQNSQYVDRVSTSPQSHVPILPKPILAPHRAGPPLRGLRLITEDIEQFEDQKAIDMNRLNRIYNTHRIHFWSMVARSYGANVSPSALEEAWRSEYAPSRSVFPPTPCGSPDSSKSTSSILHPPFSSVGECSRGFTAVNTPQSTKSTPGAVERSSFAISSLLTEDKEVRSPAPDRK